MEVNKSSDKFKNFRDEKLTNFLVNYSGKLSTQLDRSEKIKLCSSDDFNAVAENFCEKFDNEKPPIMISHVGGFYVSSSLAGLANDICSNGSKPKLLFFDRKTNNIKNAMYNTLLMNICPTKEKYITTLFGLTNIDIVKALNPSCYVSFIEQVIGDTLNYEGLTKKEKKELLKNHYELNKESIDKQISDTFVTTDLVDSVLKSSFNLDKISKFAMKKEYNQDTHYNTLVNYANGKLNETELQTFKILADNITEYLSIGENYQDLVKYLTTDIKLNSKYHILANDNIYEGYRNLTTKKGTGSVKFVTGIDIGTKNGVQKLEEILKKENFISDDANSDKFPIDIAFIPHINLLKESYSLIKKNVEKYIILNKNPGKGKNNFAMNSTVTLEVRDYKSIGALEIEKERLSRKPLSNLSELEKSNGIPLLSFIAGANYGNIYHSEVDTENMIDMAINDGVDTVYIQGLIYATYYHHQTSRRLLTDPNYETLDSRLKAAQKIIKRLNDAGIKVVYQMGDEEHHLYQDMYKIYMKEQNVSGNNFLEREDLRSKYDWVRPIIIRDLIPYLIRSGEDLTNFYTDDESKTRVSQLCHALKLYNDGLPLGDLAKYINPQFLKDSDMFKVVYSGIDCYSDIDPALSIKLLSNPNFSHITQYGKPNLGAIKNLRYYQTGTVDKFELEHIPQLFVDSRQGIMSLAYQGEQATLNVPQMINDAYYIENNELLSGIKEHILEDPTHKRVTQTQTRPNFPGGWIITGDLREKMDIIPYYKRTREVMEYADKFGINLPKVSVGYINDWQTGSPTERLYYDIKALDYMFYEAKISGLFGNGDFQQGHNYGKFPNESRHLGTSSVTQQMVSNVKLLRPYLRDSFGVIKNSFENDRTIDFETSNKIISHLSKNNLINHNSGIYQNVDTIIPDIDYKTVDLKLPSELKCYEKTIREKLSSINYLKFVDLIEGNHEANTDWDYKGFNEIELLRQELLNLKDMSGSDTDITLTEYLVNRNGDIVNAPYSFRSINGYNNINGHAFKPAGKGGGVSPTIAMAKYLDQMARFSNRIDRANGAHYHIFEMSVIDNKLLTITGGGAGQSGYEQNLGYASEPLYVIDRYLPDGRLVVETLGTKFLDDYKIQNPYVKEKGINKFIEECTTEEATIYDRDEPKKLQKIYQRQLVAKKPNTIIGPKID